MDEYDKLIHEIDGRYIVAERVHPGGWWYTRDRELDTLPDYAATLEGLRDNCGARTYRTSYAAIAAARELYWIDNWEG